MKKQRFSVDFVKDVLVSQLREYECKVHVDNFDENCRDCWAARAIRETARLMYQPKIHDAVFGREPRRGHTAYHYAGGRRVGFNNADGRIHGPTKRRWERGEQR